MYQEKRHAEEAVQSFFFSSQGISFDCTIFRTTFCLQQKNSDEPRYEVSLGVAWCLSPSLHHFPAIDNLIFSIKGNYLSENSEHSLLLRKRLWSWNSYEIFKGFGVLKLNLISWFISLNKSRVLSHGYTLESPGKLLEHIHGFPFPPETFWLSQGPGINS